MDDSWYQTSAIRWTTAALAAAAVYVCWPLWPAVVLAAWTAALARPLLVRFERGLNGKRRAAAALTLLLFVLVLLPLTLVVLGVIAGAQEIVQAISQSPSAAAALESISAGSGEGTAPSIPRNLPELVALVQRHGATGLNLLSNVAGAATAGLIGIFMYFGGAFVFLVSGDEVWRWLQRNSPLKAEHLDRLAAAFQETGRGLLVGVGLTTATQGMVAALAYLSLGVPRWWVLGPITGIASMIPFVGSALVWAPISLGLFLTGQPGKASILLVLGVAVISTADNVLRPVYARMGSLQMPMYLLFVAVFGGIAVFGTWGALLGPLIVRLSMEALEIRRAAYA